MCSGVKKIDSLLTQICGLFEKAERRVVIVSAYISAKTLDSLLSATHESIDRQIYTRWATSDLAARSTDWEAWDVAQRHKVPIYACPRLHVKLYLADDKVLVGSANATESGLHGPPIGNLELLIPEDSDKREIQDVLNNVKIASSLASPFGADIVSEDASSPTNDRTKPLPIWIPKSDPREFLLAMQGNATHDSLSHRDRIALGLPNHVVHRNMIRKALTNITVFRVVQSAFEGRLLPMDQLELRQLFEKSISSDLKRLSGKNMDLLCRWLGEFGGNTHLSPVLKDASVQLAPGRLIGSETEF